MFGKNLFSVRTTVDSAITPTGRPNLFEHVVYKIKRVFTNSFASEKKDQNSQDGQTIESPVQTPRARPVTQGTLPSGGTSATNSSHSPPSPPDWTEDESKFPSSTPPTITTPAPITSPTAPTSTTPSSILPCQETIELAAAKKKLAEIEATYVQRKLEYASYRQRVERMNLSGGIKTLTGDRDLFKARLKRAELELVKKTEERSDMEQDWKKEYDRRVWAQLLVLGAKRGLEDSGKDYAALETKFLELQSRSDSLHDEVDDEARDSQGSAADNDEHQGPLSTGPRPSQWLTQGISIEK